MPVKLHVLDLMIVAKYMPDFDIFKFKYISKAFKDIQDRILINWNATTPNNKIKNKFPNIQTINIYHPQIIVNGAMPMPHFDFPSNYHVKIVMLTSLTQIDINTIIANYLNQSCKFEIYVYNNRIQQRNQIIKSNNVTIKFNYETLILNNINISWYNSLIYYNSIISKIIINQNYQNVDKHLMCCASFETVIMNANNITATFEYEPNKDYFEHQRTITFINCHGFKTNSIKNFKNINFVNCDNFEPYTVKTWDDLPNVQVFEKPIKTIINKLELLHTNKQMPNKTFAIANRDIYHVINKYYHIDLIPIDPNETDLLKLIYQINKSINQEIELIMHVYNDSHALYSHTYTSFNYHNFKLKMCFDCKVIEKSNSQITTLKLSNVNIKNAFDEINIKLMNTVYVQNELLKTLANAFNSTISNSDRFFC